MKTYKWQVHNAVNTNRQPPAQLAAHDSGAVVMTDTSTLIPSLNKDGGDKGALPLNLVFQSLRDDDRSRIYQRYRVIHRSGVWRLAFNATTQRLTHTPLLDLPTIHPQTGIAQPLQYPVLWFVPHSERYYLVTDPALASNPNPNPLQVVNNNNNQLLSFDLMKHFNDVAVSNEIKPGDSINAGGAIVAGIAGKELTWRDLYSNGKENSDLQKELGANPLPDEAFYAMQRAYANWVIHNFTKTDNYKAVKHSIVGTRNPSCLRQDELYMPPYVFQWEHSGKIRTKNSPAYAPVTNECLKDQAGCIAGLEKVIKDAVHSAHGTSQGARNTTTTVLDALSSEYVVVRSTNTTVTTNPGSELKLPAQITMSDDTLYYLTTRGEISTIDFSQAPTHHVPSPAHHPHP